MAGLGTPLLGIALVTGLNTDAPLPPVSDTPVMTSSNAVALPVDEMDPATITSDVLEPEITVEPEPEFDKLTLTVGRGDTMERLFRKNNLSISHLMQIAQVDEAKRRFRRINIYLRITFG